MGRSRNAFLVSAALAAVATLFGQGCSAPAVGSFNGSGGDFEINDADRKTKSEKKPTKKTNPAPDEDDDTLGNTQLPDETTTPEPTENDPCLRCLGAQSQAAAQYALCASQCPANATSPACDDNCWSSKGCAAQEEICGAALNACDATCQ